MARVTADQAAQKWAQRMAASGDQIRDGVNGVTVAPGVTAAKAKNLWVQRVTASADKWATRVASVPLAEWQSKMIDVGIPRVAQGASANVGKVQDFMSQFLPHLDAGVAKVKQMPKGGLDASIARAAAMIQHNASFQRR